MCQPFFHGRKVCCLKEKLSAVPKDVTEVTNNTCRNKFLDHLILNWSVCTFPNLTMSLVRNWSTYLEVKGDIQSDCVTEGIDIHKRLDTNMMTGNSLVRNISSTVTAGLQCFFHKYCYTRHVFKVRSGEPLKITHKR